MRAYRSLLSLFLVLSLQSCEFSCHVGNKEETENEKPPGRRIRNNITLQAKDVVVEKAYLVFENGDMVPEDNVIDFSQAVKLILVIESGWTEEESKVRLGAAEKITLEGGDVLLDEKDLFENMYTGGMTLTDARRIALTASIKPRKAIRPLTDFLISFRVWDKNGPGFVEGHYKLYAR